MTYPKDDRGEYRMAYRWIDAWDGRHGHPGYCVCELREYADGTSRVHRGEPVYVRDAPPHVRFVWTVYRDAAAELMERAR